MLSLAFAFFLGSVIPPTAQWLSKSTQYLRVRANADRFCADAAESATARVSSIETLNQKLKTLREECATALFLSTITLSPEAFEAIKVALKVAGESARWSQEIELNALKAEQLELISKGRARLSAHIRGLSDECEVPGLLTWNDELGILEFETPISGFVVNKNLTRISWRYQNPKVQPFGRSL